MVELTFDKSLLPSKQGSTRSIKDLTERGAYLMI